VLGYWYRANRAVFSVFNTVLRPLSYKEPDLLITIWESYSPLFKRIGSSVPEFVDWSNCLPRAGILALDLQ
jgi:hypothetical protein